MGSQQILVIILGVITVGLAVALAVGMFGLQLQQANTDAVVTDCMRIATGAQQWYFKPKLLGGGGYSYVSLTMEKAGLSSLINDNGTYEINNITNNSVQIIGRGKENVVVSLNVYRDSVSTPIIIQN